MVSVQCKNNMHLNVYSVSFTIPYQSTPFSRFSLMQQSVVYEIIIEDPHQMSLDTSNHVIYSLYYIYWAQKLTL